MTRRSFVTLARIVPVLLAAFIATAPLRADDLDEEPKPRLRVTDRHVRALIADGAAQSPFFRALIGQLERSNVVVYVRCGRLPSRLDGQLTFVSAAGGLRYVLVQIAWDRPAQRKIATIGHELQHALEIAALPAIVDQASLAREYQRIGFERERGIELATRFDTEAAVRAGERVWKELVAGQNA
jgi:hypothetical protein